MCEQELSYVYEEYLHNNIFNRADAEMYIKSFDYSRERSSNISITIVYLYQKYFGRACTVLEDEITAEYAAIYFIKEITKGKSHLYQTIDETVNYILT
jgi:hypothetical protein